MQNTNGTIIALIKVVTTVHLLEFENTLERDIGQSEKFQLQEWMLCQSRRAIHIISMML